MKLHPWFVGVDWPSLARQKVAFVPQPDCETDTSYFSSKPVSQRSLALDLDSSRSDLLEVAALAAGAGGGAPMSPGAASLASSRSHSRAGSKRVSARRRSLRHALAEPSGASFSELRGLRGTTLSHSSGVSSTSRTSLTGHPYGVEASAGSVVRAAADLLQYQQQSGLGAAPAGQQQEQQQVPARRSTALSGASDLPAGEPAGPSDGGPLSGDDDEQLVAAAAVALGGGGGDSEMVEVEDAASLSGSSAGSVLGSSEYSSGGGDSEMSSRGDLDLLAEEEHLEALR